MIVSKITVEDLRNQQQLVNLCNICTPEKMGVDKLEDIEALNEIKRYVAEFAKSMVGVYRDECQAEEKKTRPDPVIGGIKIGGQTKLSNG